jgi:hypothetical protein
MLGLVQLVGSVQESLGWDASDVEAGSSESSSLLDANSFQALLSSLDSSNVTYAKTMSSIE